MTIPARSPGCVSCQKGEWLCVFLTYMCPASCSFCPAPFRGEDRVVSALGSRPGEIAAHLSKMRFSGLSFSGGDCFLVYDRLLEWLAFFHGRFPGCYVWAYTSGLRTTEEQLRRAAELGLNEVRFNIAASGYRAPGVMRLIRTASSLLEHAAVEIPAIPENADRVIEALPGLARAGVHFLNLHELFITEDERLSKRAFARRHVLNGVSELWYDFRSRAAMEKIASFCRREKMPFRVHLCTLRSKDVQMRARRRSMGRLLGKPWERLDAEGFLETVAVLPASVSGKEARAALGSEEGRQAHERSFLHPAQRARTRPTRPGRMFRVRFLPPMEIGGTRTLVGFERIPKKKPPP
jgi:pyruvate formate-lyase activating enzyme-like uncharacterized protein